MEFKKIILLSAVSLMLLGLSGVATNHAVEAHADQQDRVTSVSINNTHRRGIDNVLNQVNHRRSLKKNQLSKKAKPRISRKIRNDRKLMNRNHKRRPHSLNYYRKIIHRLMRILRRLNYQLSRK